MRREQQGDSRDGFSRKWERRGPLTRVWRGRHDRWWYELAEGFLLDGHREHVSIQDMVAQMNP